METYIIYDKVTGEVSTMIRTSNVELVKMNTPDNSSFMTTDVKNVEELRGATVNVVTKKVFLPAPAIEKMRGASLSSVMPNAKESIDLPVLPVEK